MSFGTQRAEAVARQQELVRKAEETRDAIAELQRAAEAAGVQDPEFKRLMEEIAQQLDQALTPEMRRQLEELRQALSQLDAARSRRALEELAEAQRQLKEALERSQTLFERAAMEGQMANLAAEARDLADEQGRWNDDVARADSAKAARQEDAPRPAPIPRVRTARAAGTWRRCRASNRSSSNRRRRRQVGCATVKRRQPPRLSRASRTPRKRQGKGGQQLDAMGQRLEQQRQDGQGEWKAEVMAAIDQMMAETSRLADRQLAITESLRSGESSSAFRAQQAAVEEGVEKLTEQYKKVSGENALVPPQIGATLEAARRQMGEARAALSTAVPGQREAGARAGEAVDALNAAAYQMARARGDVSGSGSGSGLAEAMARMNQMAQQQQNRSVRGAQMPMVVAARCGQIASSPPAAGCWPSSSSPSGRDQSRAPASSGGSIDGRWNVGAAVRRMLDAGRTPGRAGRPEGTEAPRRPG
jgi:hypothetical protein